LTDRARKSGDSNLNILKIVEDAQRDRVLEYPQDPNDSMSLQPFNDFAMHVSLQQRRKHRESISNDLTICADDLKTNKSKTPLPSLQTLLRNINSQERQEKKRKTLVAGSGNTTGIFQSATMIEEVYPKMFIPRSKTNVKSRPTNNLPKLGNLSLNSSMREQY